MNSPRLISAASLILGLAVVLGAFGAHGLEKTLSEKALATYQTGITYHFIHGLALLALGTMILPREIFKLPVIFFCLGLGLFSGFCYLYAITGVKSFAMVVPFGGLSFILGWLVLAFKTFNLKQSSSLDSNTR